MNWYSVPAAALFVVYLGEPPGAQAAVYKCTSETGGILFTDSTCPEGYSTDLVVADIPQAAEAPRAPLAPVPEEPRPAAPAGESVEAKLARLEAEAKAARLEAELEVARLQAELDEQRLRALEGELDAAREQPPVYYGGIVTTFPFAPKHFGSCKHGSGHCGAGRHRFKPKVVPPERPSCGTFGCTPSIQRRLDVGDAPRAMRRNTFAVGKRPQHRSTPAPKFRP
jgi:hypothetical protein